jgi:hypothetical protein
VLQSTEGVGFLLKPPQQFRTRHAGLDDFERDRSAGLVLLSLIDDAHTPFIDETENAISADHCGRCSRASIFLKPRSRGTFGNSIADGNRFET